MLGKRDRVGEPSDKEDVNKKQKRRLLSAGEMLNAALTDLQQKGELQKLSN
jgi:hypothetical protein